MRPEAYPLLLAAGMAAGFINTLAGGGSHLTLPLLILLGLDPNTANGTNRVGVLWQNVGAVAGFARHGLTAGRLVLVLLPVSIAGAYLGARIAVDVPPATLKLIVVAVILATLPALQWNPRPGRPAVRAGGHLDPGSSAPRPRVGLLAHAIFFAIGIYAGFIQAGVGFLILGAAVPLLGLDLVNANVLKVALVLVHTAIALPVFIAHGQVHLLAGLLLAAGSTAGAWLGARSAVRRGGRFVRWVILGAILFSVAALADVPARIGRWFGLG
ncbi:MAG TPA: sulfite exporter TauE/SafE family protein [Candidatus Eisenbacteria bacterium]